MLVAYIIINSFCGSELDDYIITFPKCDFSNITYMHLKNL